jgi:hypothetical protein
LGRTLLDAGLHSVGPPRERAWGVLLGRGRASDARRGLRPNESELCDFVLSFFQKQILIYFEEFEWNVDEIFVQLLSNDNFV